MSVICFIVGVFTGIVVMACLCGGDVLLSIQKAEQLARENKELKKFIPQDQIIKIIYNTRD